MNIVKNKGDSLLISTGLSQNSFSKTNTASLISEKSTLFHIEGKNISCEPYIFDSTASDEGGTAFFEGKAFKGEILSDILEKASYTENDIFALTSFCRAVDFALGQKILSEAVGAGGIIINADFESKKADILFISGLIFEECALHNKADYSFVQGKFIYKGLDFPSSLYFMRSVVAYRALTSHFPFSDEDTTKRQEEIFDENFIPMQLWDSQIDGKLSGSIESGLKSKIKQELFAGKRSISDSSAEKKRLRLLEGAKKFDSETFKNELERLNKVRQSQASNDSEKELEEKRAQFIKKQASVLSAKRFLRRNKNRIFAGAAAVILVTWFVSGWLKQNEKLVTTKGLTSGETVAVMYTMIHNTDVPNLQETVKGRKMKDLLTKISGYYVGSKQRLQVHPDNGTVTPEKWFFYKKTSKNWMMGITNLTIDGKPVKANTSWKTKKDRPAPLSEENGKTLVKGDEITHTAEYYFVQQAEAKIYLEKISDTVTLRWNGRQWRVVKIDGSAKESGVKSKDFIEEYFNRLEGKDVRGAIEAMRANYEWLPREEDLQSAAEFLVSEYGSVEAEKFLGN